MKHKNTVKKITAILMAVMLLALSFTACGKKQEEMPTTQNTEKPVSAGTFTMQGLNGETVTEENFKNAKLTLVNVMATWCGPCVRELPELQKLYEAYKDKGLSVIAIVMDTADINGEESAEAIATAKKMAGSAGVSFPMLIPQKGALAGKLERVSSLPTTFFIDAKGNFVGKPYVGGKDLKGWTAVTEKLLAEVETKA